MEFICRISWIITIFILSNQANGGYTPPSGIFQNYLIQDLSTHSFTVCYDQPYSIATTSASLSNCNGSWLFVGARQESINTSVSLGAFITPDIFNSTGSTSLAFPFNGAYWYYYPTYSFGFSPSQTINLRRADILTSDCNLRLSWHLDLSYGGYRAGCNTDLYSTSWRKVIYTTPVYPTSSPTPIPSQTPSKVPTAGPVIITRSPTIAIITKIKPPTLSPTQRLNTTSQTSIDSTLSPQAIAVGVGVGVSVLCIFLGGAFIYSFLEGVRRGIYENHERAKGNGNDNDNDIQNFSHSQLHHPYAFDDNADQPDYP
eukprot:gene5303-10610_t